MPSKLKGKVMFGGPNADRYPIQPLFESFEEYPDHINTEIKGDVPDWLEGCMVRIGPGKFEFGEHEMQHWFDGMGIIHRFTIKDKQVTFQSKFIESEAYKNNVAAQRITMVEFGTCSTPDPCATRFSRFKAQFFASRSDNVNVNIFKRGDALIACTDCPTIQTTDLNLNTKTKLNISNTVAVSVTSSHPHFEKDGTIYTAGSSFNGIPHYHIVKIPPALPGAEAEELLMGAEIIASIPSKNPISPAYTHSFGMTENYLVYCETPVRMNLLTTVSAMIRGRPINDIFSYHSNQMATFHVIRKSTGEVLPVKYQIKGLFFWHTINCYEENGHLVMDLCAFQNFSNYDLFAEPLAEFRSGEWVAEEKWKDYDHYPLRLVLPLHDINRRAMGENLVTIPDTTCQAILTCKNVVTLTSERLLPEGEDRIDMPVINYDQFNGKKYQYFYGTGLFINQHFMNALGKVDVKTKTSLKWQGTVDQYLSEPVFISRPDATEEDDGVVLSSVCDMNPKNTDFLLILDAKTFTEIARAHVPRGVRVPYSFHGSYYR